MQYFLDNFWAAEADVMIITVFSSLRYACAIAMNNKAEWWTAIECLNILLTTTATTIILLPQYLLNAQCDNHSDGWFVDYHWPDLRFCISAERLNRTASAWIGTSLVKPLIAGDTTDFHFFLPKSENAVFKYRPFAHLNISFLASWLSGIGGCLDTRGWQFDSWRGVLLRETFCSGALLRQPSHRVVSDPFSCQIQIRDSEMKKAKRLLLLRRVLDRVYIFEWLVWLPGC